MSKPKETFKTTLELDLELHRRAKHFAVDHRTTFTALVEEALRRYLDKEERKPHARAK